MKRLIHLYIFSLPFVSAFAISGTMTSTLVLALFILLLNVLHFVFDKPTLDRPKVPLLSYLFLCLFYFIAILAYLYSGLGEKKALNHLLAYSTVIILFFLSLLYALHRNSHQLSIDSLLRTVTLITVVSCLFTLFEAISYNLISLDLNKYIPRPIGEDYGATALGKIVRVRGFAPESGHYALMLEILAPLALYYAFVVRKKSFSVLTKFILVLLIVSNIILTYSTASFAVIAAASAALVFLYFIPFIKMVGSQMVKPMVLLAVVVSIPLLIKLEQKITVFNSIYQSVEDKLGGSFSQKDREEKFDNLVKKYQDTDVMHKLIGFGPSGFRVAGLEDAAISLYPTYLFETGLLGLLFFLLFLFTNLLFLLTIRSNIKYFLLFSYISAMAHYYFIGDYWYPWFWFLIALTMFVRAKELLKSQSNPNPELSLSA